MQFKWETEEERLARLIKIPVKKKLELLRAMNEFFNKVSSKKTKLIRKKLQESH